ncbi:uncharacterized protein LOC123913645 [Trifolium pratense]|uniref:uncharacterized protein LOC123913645 n=1 Tax=Trifolium pratense TaxID=57577 RepID=UPI001E695CDF|nr:uncharacterized protein LOC123913645 [Trifolium pratense]
MVFHQVDNDFDCVDIYKQDALQHPLLKNHKIQLYPTFAKNVVRSRPSYDGECPARKVPTYNRTRKHQIVANSSSKLQFGDLPSRYRVHPALYGDSQPRLTTKWTGGTNRGCIDKRCAGIVQITQRKSYLGDVQSPGTPIGSGDTKSVFEVKIQRDKSTGNWWLTVDGVIQVGYWPKELFTHLREGASLVRFMGQVWAEQTMLYPLMGSGRLPKEGYANAALFENLMTIDSNSYQIDVLPEDMKPYSDSNPNCYDLLYSEYSGPRYRRFFVHGILKDLIHKSMSETMASCSLIIEVQANSMNLEKSLSIILYCQCLAMLTSDAQNH